MLKSSWSVEPDQTERRALQWVIHNNIYEANVLKPQFNVLQLPYFRVVVMCGRVSGRSKLSVPFSPTNPPGNTLLDPNQTRSRRVSLEQCSILHLKGIWRRKTEPRSIIFGRLGLRRERCITICLWYDRDNECGKTKLTATAGLLCCSGDFGFVVGGIVQ